MFKFVVVLAFVAAVVAEPKPDVLFSTPYVQPYAAYSTLVSPGSTSYSSSSSSVIHPSPITYASPLLSHYIKKRAADPQFLATSYSTPYLTSGYSYPYAPSTVFSTPTLYSAPLTHLIKKRSAQLLTTPYITPTTYIANPSPVISSSYIQTPYYGAQWPLANAHFIKKRSAEAAPEPAADPQFFTAPGYASSSYINNIATPYLASPLWNNYYSASSAIPLATTHFIKKRSAEATPEAAPEPAADPQLAYSAYSAGYYGSPLYPSFPAATVYNSAPLYSSNPFLYSTLIKK